MTTPEWPKGSVTYYHHDDRNMFIVKAPGDSSKLLWIQTWVINFNHKWYETINKMEEHVLDTNAGKQLY